MFWLPAAAIFLSLLFHRLLVSKKNIIGYIESLLQVNIKIKSQVLHG